MPSARMQKDGELAVGLSHVWPFYRYYVTLQAFPWLESSFRYTQIQNARFNETSDQQAKDRGVDLKLRLVEEGKHTPEIAVQLRDMAGTGLFSSEYLVASRRYHNFDFTLGMAWGNAGTRGNIRNPLTLLSSRFETRKGQSADYKGGTLGTDFFTGEHVAIVGGIEYHTPIKGLSLKVEYDGNSYANETGQTQPLDAPLPVNFGVEYGPWDWASFSAGFERGSELMLRATVRTNLNRFKGAPKIADVRPVVAPRPALSGVASEPKALAPAFPPDVAAAETIQPLREGDLKVTIEAAQGLPSIDEAARLALRAGQSSAELPTFVQVIGKDGGREVAALRFHYDDLVRSNSLTGEPGTLIPELQRHWRASGPDAVLPKLAEPRAAVSLPAHSPARQAGDLPAEVTAKAADPLFADLQQQGLLALALSLNGREAVLHVNNRGYRNNAQAIGRVAKLMHNHVPGEVETLTIVMVEQGIPVSTTSLLRRDVERLAKVETSPQEIYYRSARTGADVAEPPADGAVVNPKAYPRVSWGVAPQLRQHVGGPDNFYFYQIYARGDAALVLAPGLKVAGAVGRNIYNNFDDLKQESDSLLPHVRSDIKDYLKGSSTWIEDFHLSYVTKLAPSFYGRVSTGLYEQMYGAVGGEILYYPPASDWALALDVNRARQRDFSGLFGFRNYNVTTGHLSYYQKMPFFFNTDGVLRFGRYLAGDWGVTAELSRTFENGVSIGVFATKTDVSAEQFGEGSFDKGVMLSIPLDLFSSTQTRSRGFFAFRPLTRDGGQRLGIPDRLYYVVDSANPESIDTGWGGLDD